jgi:Phage integrase, N-terminal SAM-like domain
MIGHIRQRSPRSWEIRYRAGNQTKTETVRGGKRDAQRRLRELQTLVDQNRHPDDPDHMTVAQWLDRWLGIVKTEIAVQTHLIISYETAVRVHIAPAIGDRQLVHLAPVDVQAFYTDLSARGRVQVAQRDVSRRSSALR